MKLNHKSIGEGGDVLIILHGLFGMLDNWQSHAREWAESRRVILVDQRNHGHSPHTHSHTYEDMVGDLIELMDDLGIDRADVLGHSMGGKTAMLAAQMYPERVRKLIVADIAPRKYPLRHQQILEGLNNVPEELAKRTDAEQYLEPFIDEPGVRAFLMKSLYWKEKGRLAFRFNLPILERYIEDIGGETAIGRFFDPALFIYGGASGYITESDKEEISFLFPEAVFYEIPNAGHWLHAEEPELFRSVVEDFLNE